ncbi:hypothetical protein JDY09_02075 [Thermoleophilum album]|uniref:hypothetical protein n=1 Tax=Thermoleophilum album TaxID=29539 RepID=UPI00237D2E3A|nr:hypothetical protein [Thermoleophilum album]WDT94063.1 hypothetical protein JDY09_02075 [Thermoleophilum album]
MKLAGRGALVAFAVGTGIACAGATLAARALASGARVETARTRSSPARIEVAVRARTFAVGARRAITLGCPRNTLAASGYAVRLRQVRLLATRPAGHNLWRFDLGPTAVQGGRAVLALRCLRLRLPPGARVELQAAERYEPFALSELPATATATCPSGFVVTAAGYELPPRGARVVAVRGSRSQASVVFAPEPAEPGAGARVAGWARCLPARFRVERGGRPSSVALRTRDVAIERTLRRSDTVVTRCPSRSTALAAFAEGPAGAEIVPLLRSPRSAAATTSAPGRVRLVVRCL